MKVFGKVILIVFLSVSVLYASLTIYYKTHFIPGTNFGSINISGMTVAKADEIIKEHFNNQSIKITLKGETLKELPRKDFIDNTAINDNLKEQLKKQNSFAWPFGFFKHQDINFEKVSNKQNSSQPLSSWLEQYNNNKIDATNANIKYENGDFIITEAKEGTKLDINKATQKILDAVTNNKETVNLDDCFVQPTIKQDSSDLQKKLTEIKKIANIKATYKFNNEEVSIPKEEIASWLSIDKDGNISVDQDKVQSYLKELGDEYNTAGHNIKFHSTNQGEVSVPCETYSWSINTKVESKKLAQQILKGEDFTRTPAVLGSASPEGNFIGSTYIEVDKSAQHMWLYKDGNAVISTDIVTGKPGQETPVGVFYVWNKERNATLRGQDYASPVSYWMPIDWTGVGIHDSDWQTAYGGTRWRDGYGSHGCINTPPTVMANLYENTPVGTPVIVLP